MGIPNAVISNTSVNLPTVAIPHAETPGVTPGGAGNNIPGGMPMIGGGGAGNNIPGPMPMVGGGGAGNNIPGGMPMVGGGGAGNIMIGATCVGPGGTGATTPETFEDLLTLVGCNPACIAIIKNINITSLAHVLTWNEEEIDKMIKTFRKYGVEILPNRREDFPTYGRRGSDTLPNSPTVGEHVLRNYQRFRKVAVPTKWREVI
jgi:hypothetical protein